MLDDERRKYRFGPLWTRVARGINSFDSMEESAVKAGELEAVVCMWYSVWIPCIRSGWMRNMVPWPNGLETRCGCCSMWCRWGDVVSSVAPVAEADVIAFPETSGPTTAVVDPREG